MINLKRNKFYIITSIMLFFSIVSVLINVPKEASAISVISTAVAEVIKEDNTSIEYDDFETALNEAILNRNSTLKLLTDIKLNERMLIKGQSYLTLDLNGYDLTSHDNEEETIIYIAFSSTFFLSDSIGGGIIKDGVNTLSKGGAIENYGSFLMQGGIISNNTANEAGAIYNDNSGIFIMQGGEISNNTATSIGGGIYNYGTFTMEGGEIKNNTAEKGGGLAGHYLGKNNLNGGIISDNQATFGGGIFSYSTTNMNGTTIVRNNASTGGGVLNFGTFNLNDGLFSMNTADEDGGAIHNSEVLNINDGLIEQNIAKEGAGIHNSGLLTMNGGVITNNTSENGGGVSNNKGPAAHGTFLFKSGSITNNTATINGGGIYNYANSKLNISGGYITENSAENGGGVYNIGTSSVDGGEIKNNTASYGGGIYNDKGQNSNYGYLTLNEGVISQNTVTSEGGGIANFADFKMNGGEISDNTAENGGGVYNISEYFTINGGAIKNNTATQNGGGILNEYCVNLNGGAIFNNTANNGSGIYNRANNTLLVRIIFHSVQTDIYDNLSNNQEGGIYFSRYTFFSCITDVTTSSIIFENWYNLSEGESIKLSVDWRQKSVVNFVLTDDDNGNIGLVISSGEYYISSGAAIDIDETITQVTYTGRSLKYNIVGTHSYLWFTIEYNLGNDVWSSTAPINVGEYDVRITRERTLEERDFNITIIGGLVITKATPTIDTSEIETNYTYNGEERSIISGAKLNGVTAELIYTTNTFTNAGTYTVTITLPGTVNYDEVVVRINVTVEKIILSIDTTEIETSYTYNGEEQSVISGAKVEGIEAELIYTTNTFTNAGAYTVTITLPGTVNYDEVVVRINVTVEKIILSIDTTEIETSYTYNGEEQSVISGAKVEGIEAELIYTTNTFTNAGTYTVTITLPGTVNYDEVIERVNVTVEKANLDLGNISFEDKTVFFNFDTHIIELTGKLPEGVTVTYSGGEVGNVGEYTFTATFTLSEELLLNYNVIEPMTATLTVSSLWLNLIVIILTALLVLVVVNYIRIRNTNKENNNVKTMSIIPLALLPLTSVAVPIQLYLIIGLTCGIVSVLIMSIFNKSKIKKTEEPILTKEVKEDLIAESKETIVEKETEETIEEPEHDSIVNLNNLEELESDELESEDSTDFITARVSKETGRMILIRYKKSYSARLNLSDDINKDYHSILKNKLLSYKKVKSRISWNYESFNFGRIQASKINVRGKSLFVYLPLNPEDYIDSKYSFNDCSHIKKYEQLPFRIKVKSNRGLKHALELIEIAMEQLQVELLNNYDEVNYYQKNRGFEKLLEEGLIKEVIDEETFKDLTEINKEFLDSNNIMSIDLESIKQLKFNPEIITIKKEAVQGKKEIINIDTLSNNFNNGDVITIDSLKNKKLISKNAKSVKCLARGILDKQLTLDLQDYSTDAIKMIIITGGKVL